MQIVLDFGLCPATVCTGSGMEQETEGNFIFIVMSCERAVKLLLFPLTPYDIFKLQRSGAINTLNTKNLAPNSNCKSRKMLYYLYSLEYVRLARWNLICILFR